MSVNCPNSVGTGPLRMFESATRDSVTKLRIPICVGIDPVKRLLPRFNCPTKWSPGGPSISGRPKLLSSDGMGPTSRFECIHSAAVRWRKRPSSVGTDCVSELPCRATVCFRLTILPNSVGIEPLRRLDWRLKPVTHSLRIHQLGSGEGSGDGTIVGTGDGSSVGVSVGSAVGDAVGNAVGNTGGNAVGNAVGNVVGLSVGGAVGSDVGSSVGSIVGGDVGGRVGSVVGWSVGTGIGSVRRSRPCNRREFFCALTGALVGESYAQTTPYQLLVHGNPESQFLFCSHPTPLVEW